MSGFNWASFLKNLFGAAAAGFAAAVGSGASYKQAGLAAGVAALTNVAGLVQPQPHAGA
jgi:hypothetical protein